MPGTTDNTPPAYAPEPMRDFITRVLASDSTRLMAVAYLRAAAKERQGRNPATAKDRAEAMNFDALADLYAHADGPFPESEKRWWDLRPWRGSPPDSAHLHRDNMAIDRVGV